MMAENIFLSSYEFNKFSHYKNAIESNFGVSIDLPEADTSNLCSFLSNDVLIVQLNGPEKSIKAASEHITCLVTPEESLPFYIPLRLKCVFNNITWLRMLAKIHDVDIKIQTGVESLLVSGSTRDVRSALTAMTILDCTFQNTEDAIETHNLDGFKVEIPGDLLLPPAIKHCYRSVQHLPLQCVKLLLSWIKESLNYNVKTVDISIITLDDSLREESIIILDTPPPPLPEVVDLAVSDEETDNNNVQNAISHKGQSATSSEVKNTAMLDRIQNAIITQAQNALNNHIHDTASKQLPNTRRANRKERQPFLRDRQWVSQNSEVTMTQKRRTKRKRKQSNGTNTETQNPENVNVKNKKAKLRNNEINIASTSRKNPLADLGHLDLANQRNFNFSKPSTSTAAGGSSDVIPINSWQKTSTRGPALQNIPQPLPDPNRVLRPIVIDGSNVARSHGAAEKIFSCKGIELCVNFFLNRGHKDVVAFVPQYRRRRHNQNNITGHDILEKLASSQHIAFTPSRIIRGKPVSSYDDRFIVRLASDNGGVIISNDLFRDIMHEKPEWTTTIEERLLMYCFVGDRFMIPDDPLGLNGPLIDEFLSFPSSTTVS